MSEEQIPQKPKDKRTKQYKEWVAKYEAASEGVGDTVAKITKATGIEKAVKFLAGEDCGCNDRKDTLNHLFPYNKPNCFTEQEFEVLDELFSNINWRLKTLTGEDIKSLYVIYNRVMNTADKPSGCGSCVMGRLNKLERLYKEYL
tara:strand:- start:870 stop:1304 length:435 start_codon:yes stop_codon:yes gene_type:complete